MSSPGLPRLDIDVRPRRAERCIAVTGSALAVMLPWLTASALDLQAVSAATLWGTGLLLAAVAAAGFHRSGWLTGRRRIQRMIWTAEGEWLLLDGAGRARKGQLRADSRMGPGCLWLRWQLANPHSMLLLPGDIPSEQLRQLSVRLRIDRPRSAALPRAAAI
jgi:hypothetical protein